MPRARRDLEDEVPFYRVQLIDAELGKIRFGPFTTLEFDQAIDMGDDPERSTPHEMADVIRNRIRDKGLITALTELGIWGGVRIVLKGDDGTDILITEVEAR